MTDIEDRKRADEKLRLSEASLLEGQRLVHMCSWAHDVLSGIVTCSPEVNRIWGIAPEQDAFTAEFFVATIVRTLAYQPGAGAGITNTSWR